MTKWNVLSGIAIVVAGVLLPQAARAEYQGAYNSPGFSSSLSQAQSLLGPVSSALNGQANGDSFGDIADQRRNEAQAQLDKISKSIEEDQQETKNRQTLSNWNKRIENAQKARDAFQIKGLADQNAAYLKSKAALAQTAQITTARGVSPQDVDTTPLGKQCKNGVDFTQFQQMSSFLGSQPFQYFKSNYQKMLSDATDKQKKEFIEKLKKLKKNFAERSQQVDPADFQQNIQSLTPDALAKARNGEWAKEKRLKEQRQQLAAKQLQMNEAERLLNDDLFDKIIPSLIENKKNQNELEQLKTNFIQSLKDTLAITHQTVYNSARQLEENCKKTAKKIGTDSLAPGTLTTQVYNILASSPFLVNAANQRLQGFNYYRNNLNCTNATSNLEAMYGEAGDIGTKINALSGTQSPQDFLGGVNNVLNAMRNANGQVGGVLKPSIDSCKHVENEYDALEKDRDQAQQLVGQLNGSQVGAGAGGPLGAIGGVAAGQAAAGQRGGQFGFGGRRRGASAGH